MLYTDTNAKTLHIIEYGVGFTVNTLSSILIIFSNKIIYQTYKFPNMSLTWLHFVITFFGVYLCSKFNTFKIKRLPILKMLPLSLTFCGFVVLTNLSLGFNTVGTYQIIKILTTPCVMLISFFYYKKRYSFKIILTVIPTLVGASMNSYYDVKFNSIGMIIGLLGVFVTSLYQVWVGEKQKEFEVNSMQLLYYQAPLSAFLLMFVIPFFEPIFGVKGVLYREWSHHALLLILSSGVIAFSVNLSIYWVIGNTSPLAYNMLGHFKTMATIILSFIIFEDPFNVKQAAGILVCLSGVLAYSVLSLQEKKKAQQQCNLSIITLPNSSRKF